MTLGRSLVLSLLLVGCGGTPSDALREEATAFVAVLTQHNNNSRTGANLQETILKPSNVNSASFGKLFSRPVDEIISAQPLYVPNVKTKAGTFNVVYVTTENNSIYAFDANGSATDRGC